MAYSSALPQPLVAVFSQLRSTLLLIPVLSPARKVYVDFSLSFETSPVQNGIVIRFVLVDVPPPGLSNGPVHELSSLWVHTRVMLFMKVCHRPQTQCLHPDYRHFAGLYRATMDKSQKL